MSKAYRKLLENKARALNVSNIHKLDDVELENAIKDRGGNIPTKPGSAPAVIEAKAVEVKPAESKTVVSAPSISSQYYGQPITVNVPIPAVNLHNRPAPAWWEIAAEFRNAALYMVCGAALYALVTAKLL